MEFLDVIFAEISERGLTVALGKSGPVIRGPQGRITPALIGALKEYRQEVIERLQAAQPTLLEPVSDAPTVQLVATPPRAMQCRWRNGYEGAHAFPVQDWPVGAGWWRYADETEWRPIPGRELQRGEVQP